VALLGLNAALAWVALQASLQLAHLVWYGLGGYFLPGTGVARIGRELVLLRRLQEGVFGLTAIVFLAWLHGIYASLATAGAGRLRYSPGQAVAAFLVPVANLVRPYRVVREAWAASQPDSGFPAGAGPPWLTAWWLVFLGSVVVDLALAAPLAGVRSLLRLSGVLPLVALAECLRIGAGVLAIVVVGRIGSALRERLEGPSRP
jgi:hypothetical protein